MSCGKRKQSLCDGCVKPGIDEMEGEEAVLCSDIVVCSGGRCGDS